MKKPNIVIKKTEVSEILKEWKVVLLRDTGELQYGYTCSATNKNTGTKLVRITDINEDAKLNWESIPYCEVNINNYEKYRLNVGDILFARIGATTGKTAFVDRGVRGVFASYLIRFKSAREELDTKFLYYFTQSNAYWIQVHKNKEGQLKKGLNAKVLGNIALSLPPLPEQKKIAEILSTVDQAIEKVDKGIEKTQKLKKGLMQELLTKGIGHKEFKDTEIGRIPKAWKIMKLGEIGNVRYGLGQPPATEPDGIPMIRATNVKRGKIAKEGLIFINPSAVPNSRDPFLRAGDILVVRIGAYTGDVALVTKEWEGAVAGYDLIVTPSDTIDSQFLTYYLLSSSVQKRYFVGLKVRSAQPHLNSSQVEETPISIPPLPEQQKIAEILSTVDKRLESLRNRKENLEKIKKGLMNDLLTGRKRVKLN
jgi:type I restriction enzyme S subunit